MLVFIDDSGDPGFKLDRGLGQSLSNRLRGLSRMQKWYGISQESRTAEGPADELIRKKATGRFRRIT